VDLKGNYIPTLDGARLNDTPDGFAFEDGTLVPDARLDEVVYVSAAAERPDDTSETGWWRALGQAALDQGAVAREPTGPTDVSAILAALGTPPALDDLEIEAGFFHRTLTQWITHDPSGHGEAPLWDYDCWKADVELEATDDDRSNYVAHLYRGESREPEQYRYWVTFTDDGRIAASGWLSDPPDLIGGEDEFAAQQAAAITLSEEAAAALMADDS
jgi:hypothetical protein